MSRELRSVGLLMTALVGVLALATVLATLSTGGPLAAPDPRRAEADSGRPNILIIVTDDQRTGSLRQMPRTQELFKKQGVNFPNAFAHTPVCCPSRASIMSGRYTHNHNVRYFEPYKLNQRSTLQAYLKSNRYRTALFGKYLNNWRVEDDPPHFDRWASFPQSRRTTYKGGEWNVNGVVQDVESYSTDFITEHAMAFLEANESSDNRPWMMYLAPPAAHFPYVAEPKYEGATLSGWDGNPAVFDDIDDKPPYIRSGREGKDCDLECGRETRLQQHRVLLSVDDMVRNLFLSLEALGEADNTLAFFMSDNGMLWGEFGLTGKRYPYRKSVEIPLLMRWPDGLKAGADRRLVGTIDIVPTVLDAAGISRLRSIPIDGRSLLNEDWRRKGVLLESWGGSSIPDWASIRRKSMQYIEYYYPNDGGVLDRELYDLRRDPCKRHNLLSPASEGREGRDQWSVRRLHRRLTELRKCSGKSCRR